MPRSCKQLEGGAPDFATMHITYVPGDVCVELKSLKLYLWSFRNDGIFYERAVNRILDDLSRGVKPVWMEVVGDFNIRGGIKSVITARVGARTSSAERREPRVVRRTDSARPARRHNPIAGTLSLPSRAPITTPV